MLSRLLEAHEAILTQAHDAAARTAELGDDGTNDLLVSQVIGPANSRRGSSPNTWSTRPWSVSVPERSLLTAL